MSDSRLNRFRSEHSEGGQKTASLGRKCLRVFEAGSRLALGLTTLDHPVRLLQPLHDSARYEVQPRQRLSELNRTPLEPD